MADGAAMLPADAARGAGAIEEKSDAERTFYAAEKFADARRCLLERGFKRVAAHTAASAAGAEEGARESPVACDVIFDNAKCIAFDCVGERQVVNHFVRIYELGKKSNLARNLRNLTLQDRSWSARIAQHVPRSWCVDDANEFAYFLHDYACGQAGAILRRALERRREAGSGSGGLGSGLVRAALSVARKWSSALPRYVQGGCCSAVRSTDCITSDEWALLTGKEAEAVFGSVVDAVADGDAATHEGDDDALTEREWAAVEAEIEQLDAGSGSGQHNVWIVKPNNLSKGAGIEVHHLADPLLASLAANDYQMVAQRYVERPLVVRRKKVDIRQWVLVTELNPLTIWFFNSAYVRFSAADYTMEDLGDKFVHLCNNSVAQHSELYHEDLEGTVYTRGGAGGDGDVVRGSMWSSEQLRQHLASEHGEDVWSRRIRPQMVDIAVMTLKSVQARIDRKGHGFEWFGFDFLIDDTFGVHLLEVNVSPDITRTTSVLRRMVPAATDDLFRVVLNEGGAYDDDVAAFVSKQDSESRESAAMVPPDSPSCAGVADARGDLLEAQHLRWAVVFRDEAKPLTELRRLRGMQSRLLQQQQRARKAPLRIGSGKCASPAEVLECLGIRPAA